ncbi:MULTISPECIES: hypothetical protein [Anoxybacillus]|uniref:hypothetical protein n=1 Tax=Anoxybacillus TaxID=150247 RepID=UPI00148E484A|nr:MULTISPECIES: hypothetical protein [Anoxybacillus]MED0688212.1 hypothetical protein [Anoxybacillus ayderensis]NNU96525.1 hypothetical protein [Anoxybacillus sp. EFIL]
MSVIFEKLRCPIYSVSVKPEEKVILGTINTVIYYECYQAHALRRPLFPVRDEGTFEQIVDAYELFNEE